MMMERKFLPPLKTPEDTGATHPTGEEDKSSGVDSVGISEQQYLNSLRKALKALQRQRSLVKHMPFSVCTMYE